MNSRERRHKRIRKRVYGTESKPRLSVYRSSKHMFAQLINDDLRVTIIGMSTLSLKSVDGQTKTEKARNLGLELGAKIVALGKYKKIVFDRGGYKYHGRVKALAEGLREAGLEF